MVNWLLIVSGISIGGLIGTYLSKKVAMTDMPQMVAALNSMGGMSAVLVAWAAFLSPGSFGLLGRAISHVLESNHEIVKTGRIIPKGETGIKLNIQDRLNVKQVVEPLTGLYFPETHDVHPNEPTMLLNFPALHSKH